MTKKLLRRIEGIAQKEIANMPPKVPCSNHSFQTIRQSIVVSQSRIIQPPFISRCEVSRRLQCQVMPCIIRMTTGAFDIAIHISLNKQQRFVNVKRCASHNPKAHKQRSTVSSRIDTSNHPHGTFLSEKNVVYTRCVSPKFYSITEYGMEAGMIYC